jgi:hypothetical protein
VLRTAVLGLGLRLVYVANTLWRWASRDAVRGTAEVGRGLATALRVPAPGLRRAGWGVFDLAGGALFGLVSLVPQVVGVLRPLTASELTTGRGVYGETIPWRRVRVFPGSYLARLASRRAGEPVAVVTMRVVHVPPQFDSATTRGRAWLVHELMHVWQGEHTGPSCMARALVGQLGAGYDYGGERALLAHAERGLAAFNPEQQADIMRDYYRRLVSAGDLAPFQPYVRQVLAVGRHPSHG